MPKLPGNIIHSIHPPSFQPFTPLTRSIRGIKKFKPFPGPFRQPYELPPGYSYYPNHNDIPMTPPPPHSHIYTSTIPPPHLPRDNVFNYLFPPKVKGDPPRYYPKTDPKAIGFIDAATGREVLREEIPVRAMWLASGISKLGIKRLDVVCIFGMNSLEWVEACFAVQAADATVTPANYAYTPTELLHQLTDSGSKLIFIQPSLLPTLEEALKIAPPTYTLPRSNIILLCPFSSKPANTPYLSMEEIYGPQRRPRRFPADSEKETAYLCYSSGTTGRAKGVMTSFHNITSQIQAVNLVYEPLGAGDVVLGILPFSHIYGLTLLVHQPLTRGAPVIVLPKFDEIQVLEAIQKYKVTWALVVPPVLLALANSKHLDKYDLSSLRGVQTGAAPCSDSLIQAFEARFPQVRVTSPNGRSSFQPACRVTQGYGMTETSPVTHVMTAEEGANHVGSIGRIMPTMQARLVDVESGVDVADGERGELWLRGPSVMRGYWKNEEATRNAFAKGGWLKTGDVARVDNDGYFYIVDRAKELIKYKGFQVPPAELEALLITHPLISDAGVIGIYSESQATELPRAYISLKAGLSSLGGPSQHAKVEKEIMYWVEGKVANHKRLRGGIVFVDVVPKSPSGKILRKDLRVRAKEEVERRGGMERAKL